MEKDKDTEARDAQYNKCVEAGYDEDDRCLGCGWSYYDED